MESDHLIATAGPAPNSPAAAISIIKTKQTDGTYLIEVQAGCANMFGCIPSLELTRADIAKFIYTGTGLDEYRRPIVF